MSLVNVLGQIQGVCRMNIPNGVALVNCAISHIFTIIKIKLLKRSFLFIGCPIRLGQYLGGEGMYQKSENMWSFQMTPSNYRYVIFTWAKCLHQETA